MLMDRDAGDQARPAISFRRRLDAGNFLAGDRPRCSWTRHYILLLSAMSRIQRIIESRGKFPMQQGTQLVQVADAAAFLDLSLPELCLGRNRVSPLRDGITAGPAVAGVRVGHGLGLASAP
jgi:hypothetical protein